MDRICARCKQPKRDDEFYRGHLSWCRECFKVYVRERRPRKRPVLPEGQRKCARCQEIKPTEEFRLRSSGGWYSYCRSCWNPRVESKRRERTGYPRGPLGSRWAKWRTTGRKVCPICTRDLPLKEFRFDKRSGYPYGWCRKCGVSKHGEWLKTPAGRAAQKRDAQKRGKTQKAAVRRFTYAAIELGLLVRRPCEVCGVTRVQAHHTDYSQPLVVRWLCKDHHDQAHHEGRSEG